ncbi:patatin [Methylobacterium sp. Leaf111]|uniref:patatin-like phospholipase family protein n=1 Tax=Methylobacterium sp. Leaf111 TaxID=1736257 RepID=UPI0006FB8091|nr:patatin-like phospholipase family protein [Methylobacterium sp. Leaf111]KQP62777.1 patatin [Methylobacterium sp. Leaf111]
MADGTGIDKDGKLQDGIALCLSGGGYRAMVFHLGSLLRLNEAGLLKRLSRVSSVSGGSITAACLGLHWRDLDFDVHGRARGLDVVVDKIRTMAATTIDTGAIIGGILLPGSVGERVARAYDDTLFDGAELADLPADGDGPRFVINATNVQSAVSWRFSRPYMGDYRVGLVPNPRVDLAFAVAASSAFPPVLSPVAMDVADAFDPRTIGDLDDPAYRGTVMLTDGGVYDNLGLETAFRRYRTLLVSDGGQRIGADAQPARDWARHSARILDVVDNQVRSLRKRRLIEAFERKDRTGAYWGIRSDHADYRTKTDPLGCADRDPKALAAMPTRLRAMPDELQERLINWGYAIADAALRTHFGQELRDRYGVTISDPTGFPYPRGY